MAFVDATIATGQSATPSVAVPTGVQAGDRVYIGLAVDMTGNITSYPTSFTELAEGDTTFDRQVCSVSEKILTGADSGTYTFPDHGMGSQYFVCIAIALRGRHASDAAVATVNNVDSGGASPRTITATGVTAVAGDDLLWFSFPDVNADGIGNLHTPPTDFTEAEDGESAWVNGSVAYRANVSAGATGNISGTFAMTSGECAYSAFLIRVPAAAGAADTGLAQPYHLHAQPYKARLIAIPY